MKLPASALVLAVAVAGAAALTALHGNAALEERVLRSEVTRTFPEIAPDLERQPAGVQLVLLDYAGDDALVLSARLALTRFPELAPPILADHGASTTFRDILREHGASIIPAIAYFREQRPQTIGLRSPAREPRSSAGVHDDTAEVDADPAASTIRHGTRAIRLIGDHGHDFLGQFVIDTDGEPARLQSERFASGVKQFFTSGVTNVEAKWRTGEDITATDYGWATVDILLPVAALRLARGGQLAARSARTSGAAHTGAQAGRAGLQIGRTGRLVAAGGGLAGIGYIAMNPGVLNSIGAGIAETLGLPAWLVSGSLWFLLLLPLLLLLRLGQRWLLRPAGLLLRGLILLLTALYTACERVRTARQTVPAADTAGSGSKV